MAETRIKSPEQQSPEIDTHKYSKLAFEKKQWQPTPVLLPGKSHGRRRLVGCSPWGLWGLDTNEWLHFHFSLACIGEGNGNPLQCSCLENPGDRGAWWASVYGVTHSQTRLKWFSRSSSSRVICIPSNQEYILPMRLTYDNIVDVDLDYPDWGICIKFLNCKVILVFLFHAVFFGKKSQCIVHN